MSAHKRRIAYTLDALIDLEEIQIYGLQAWGTNRADAYLRDLRDAVDELLSYPEIGRQRDDIELGIRARFIGRHVIFYRVTTDAITVLRVLHERADVPHILE